MAAAAAWSGDGLSPPARLATASLNTPAMCQLRLDERRRDDVPPEREPDDREPLPFVAPRLRVPDDDDWRRDEVDFDEPDFADERGFFDEPFPSPSPLPLL